MDTMVSVSVAHEDPEAAKAAMSVAFGEMERVDKEMARIEGTPLWALNKAGKGVVSPDTAAVLDAALRAARTMGGAFDPTMAAVIDLWKVKSGPHAPPTQEEIDRARAATGWQRISMDSGGNVELNGVAIDLGGIAKGYAVDLAAKALREAGFENFLVNAGGDLYLSGDKNGKPWKVGLQHPRNTDQVFPVTPKNGGLVTSGDYERYFEWEGERYHHIFSPATGSPADAGCVSVTVWADTAMRADILATVAFVLGPEKGLALLEKEEGVEGLIIDAGLAEIVTSGFDAVVSSENAGK
jgi:thiamine biosynthesis lipoprotein